VLFKVSTGQVSLQQKIGGGKDIFAGARAGASESLFLGVFESRVQGKSSLSKTICDSWLSMNQSASRPTASH
jgi:hypothetical protein